MANIITKRYRKKSGGERFSFALFFFLSFLATMSQAANNATSDSEEYDRDAALILSQAAIGKSLGEYSFVSADGRNIRLQDYAGKPLLVSMIFTSCHHICPTTTKHIQQTTLAAQEVLGKDSFEIVSIGFDTANDTPEAMKSFARQQGVYADNWQFLSATPATIEQLSEDLGFQYFASPRGFDHLIQLSMIDREGKVYSQVYGMKYELPALVEPLKQLVLNRPESAGHPISGLVDRVRLFCTVYNPATGRYEIDNTLFIQIAVGFMMVFSITFYLVREARRARRN
jgi:protein SCO1/2